MSPAYLVTTRFFAHLKIIGIFRDKPSATAAGETYINEQEKLDSDFPSDCKELYIAESGPDICFIHKDKEEAEKFAGKENTDLTEECCGYLTVRSVPVNELFDLDHLQDYVETCRGLFQPCTFGADGELVIGPLPNV